MKRLLRILAISLLFIFPVANHSAVGFINPAVANADTGFVDPTGDDTPLEWTGDDEPFEERNYTYIDDGIRQGTFPVMDYIFGGAGSIDVFDMSSITPVSSVSSVVVWVYGGYVQDDSDAAVSIYMAGDWATNQNLGLPSMQVDAEWRSVTFNGTWTQVDLDTMRVRLTGIGSTRVFAMYCVITYTTGDKPPSEK